VIVADTSVLVDHLRGRPEALALFERSRATAERLAASVLTKVEVLGGVRSGEERRTRVLLDTLEWLPVEDEIAESAGGLAQRFSRSHPGIEVVDYVIAATVEAFGADLWTRNRKHFPMFPDLPDPYEAAHG
jgi:predicted nucleic acid-binding protein